MDMMLAQDLQDWLAERPRQVRTRDEIDRFARDWDRGEVQRSFTEVMARLPDHSAEAVAEAACELFAEDAWVDRLIGSLAEKMRADPFFDPPFRPMSSDVHTG